jgi:hypothetical protein
MVQPVRGRRRRTAVKSLNAARLVAATALAATVLAAGSARADTNPNPQNVTGSLIGGGELSGTVGINFAVDPSASYTATITVDGSPLVNASVTQGSARLSLDTTTLHDGSHSVLVTVADGSSSATVWNGTIETDNAPRGGIPNVTGAPTVGATLTATPGSWSPTPTAIAYQWERCTTAVCAPVAGANNATYVLASADEDAELEVVVSAANANGTTLATSAPTPAIVLAGAASADPTSACADPQLTAAIDGHATRTVSLGEGATLDGVLRCGTSPLGPATVELTISAPGAQASRGVATVQTAADGSFSYALPAGPSRKITLSYPGTTPQAIASVTLLVKPRITLSITPRATSNGHTITFAGRVLGGHIASHGLSLQLQYREGNRWMIYTDIVASARKGRFLYHYTFERTTVAITYTFRVAIPSSGVAGYPFAPAASAPRSVHVVP